MSKAKRGWIKEHLRDPYVKKAQQSGYRSRAVYKLIEIQKRDRLFSPGMRVIELGAAPGGWSQFIVQAIKPKGQIVAVDLLTMDPVPGVEFVQGDFTNSDILQVIKEKVGDAPVDWVVSDMLPNLSGNESIDIPRAMYLAELVLEFAQEVLSPTGGLLMKVFQGEGFEALLYELKSNFSKVVIRKPEASRSKSREIYVLARSLKRS